MRRPIGWVIRLPPGELAMCRPLGVGSVGLAHGVASGPEGDAAWRRELAVLGGLVSRATGMGVPAALFSTGPSGQLAWEDAADRLVGRMASLVAQARDRGVALVLEGTMSMRGAEFRPRSPRRRSPRGPPRRRDGGGPVLRVGTLSVPNRWVPGDGDLPIARLLAETLALGYRGVVDLELVGPAIKAEGPEFALSRALKWLREIWEVDSEGKP